MGFLISLLVMILILGLIYWIITLFPIPEPFKKIALAIVLVICLIWLIGMLVGTFPYFPVYQHRF